MIVVVDIISGIIKSIPIDDMMLAGFKSHSGVISCNENNNCDTIRNVFVVNDSITNLGTITF